jgi:hypothetical protein
VPKLIDIVIRYQRGYQREREYDYEDDSRSSARSRLRSRFRHHGGDTDSDNEGGRTVRYNFICIIFFLMYFHTAFILLASCMNPLVITYR